MNMQFFIQLGNMLLYFPDTNTMRPVFAQPDHKHVSNIALDCLTCCEVSDCDAFAVLKLTKIQERSKVDVPGDGTIVVRKPFERYGLRQLRVQA